MSSCATCGENGTLRDCLHVYCQECWIILQLNQSGKCFRCRALIKSADTYVNKKLSGPSEDAISALIKREGKRRWDLEIVKARNRRNYSKDNPFTTYIVHICSPEYGIVGFSTFKYQIKAEEFALKQFNLYNCGNDIGYTVNIYKNIQGNIGTLGQAWENNKLNSDYIIMSLPVSPEDFMRRQEELDRRVAEINRLNAIRDAEWIRRIEEADALEEVISMIETGTIQETKQSPRRTRQKKTKRRKKSKLYKRRKK